MLMKVNGGAFSWTTSAGGCLDGKSTPGSEVLYAESAVSNYNGYNEGGRMWITKALETFRT